MLLQSGLGPGRPPGCATGRGRATELLQGSRPNLAASIHLRFVDCSRSMPQQQNSPPAGSMPSRLPPTAVWLDLLNGSDAEKAYVERTTGMRVPTLSDLQEIESSSRSWPMATCST